MSYTTSYNYICHQNYKASYINNITYITLLIIFPYYMQELPGHVTSALHRTVDAVKLSLTFLQEALKSRTTVIIVQKLIIRNPS